jgi:hypothetical protein
VETGGASAGSALGLASQVADGELLLILGADVTLETSAPEVVARAAAASPAEVFIYPVSNVGDGDGKKTRLAVPVGGPALMGLSYPYFGDGGFAIRPDALRELGGFSDSPSLTSSCVDLLNRAALAGYRIEVVPAVVARRIRPDPLDSLNSGDAWLEVMPWDVAPEDRLEFLRPFRRAVVPAELAALYRRSHELAAELRVRHEREFLQLVDEHEELGANAARVQRAYDELLVHTRRVQQAHDTLAASQQELRSQLEIVYGSRSWRITAPLRALGTRWRHT